MVRAGVAGSWAVMGWWGLGLNHQGSVGSWPWTRDFGQCYGPDFRTDQRKGRAVGQLLPKRCKRGSFVPFLSNCLAGFSRAVGAGFLYK